MAADRESLRRRLRDLFVEELDEHVEVLNRGFLALEAGGGTGDAAAITELFRAAHSLKGAARSADVPAVEKLSHRLEDALAGLRDGSLAAEGPVLEAFFRSADAVSSAGRRLRAGQDPAGPDVASAGDALMEVLRGREPEERGPGSPTAASVVRAVSPPGPEAPPATPPGTPVHDDQRPVVEMAATVRVASSKLEALLNHTGELIAARQQVEALADDITVAADRLATAAEDAEPAALLDGLARAAASSRRVLRQAVQAVADGVRDARMLPFAYVGEGLERSLRDLARASGKEAHLVVEGDGVELERSVAAALREPVLHLVRNAVDHGIEPPAERERALKPRSGLVRLGATLRGGIVEVAISDDGSGIDVAALRAAAGDVACDEMTQDDLALAFMPGVSTAPAVTEVSGRGVGLDAARAAVERLGGSMRLMSEPGRGTDAILSVPITLSALRALLVKAGDEVVAFPTSTVLRLVRMPPADVRVVDEREVFRLDGRTLPVLRLRASLGFDGPAAEVGDANRGKDLDAVVVGGHGGTEAAFVVDGLLDEQEIVMKPLGERVAGLPAALGVSLLSSGRVALVLNPILLARLMSTRTRAFVGAARPTQPGRPSRVLLVEDTVTTRALERSILEAAGYDVIVAVDGLDGWQLLQEHGADLVVSDVQMPRMDGFDLCRAIRSSPHFRDLPVVLVTSLASAEDRRRGVEAGANAYVVKSDFEQPVLLETIARLL